jgi:lysine 6-dehydrogenase
VGKLIVLGMGLMGPAVAKICTEEAKVNNVKGCDVDSAKLEVARSLVASEKFEAIRIDVSDHVALVHAIRDCDVVVNATSDRLSIPVLKAAMQVKVNFVDLAEGAYALDGDIYREVEEAGITVIPGCGVDPGLVDVLAGHGMDLMQKTEEVYLASGGMPKDPRPPLKYKILFGGTRIPLDPAKVPLILKGKRVMANRFDDPESVSVEGCEEMEAFYDGCPSFLLQLCLNKGVRTFKSKSIKYAGFVEKLEFLRKLGVTSSDPVSFNGKEVVPLDFFQELIYPRVKFDAAAGDRDITVVKVRVKGKSSDGDVEVTYELVDTYDEERNITSMAKTTGCTAAIISRMLATRDISERGIQWPVRVVKGELFEEFMKNLLTKGVQIRESLTRTRRI